MEKKMNPKIKQEWLRALRSGDYVQGTGALKGHDYEQKVDTFCCLGVLCDIAEKKGLGVWEGLSFVVGNETRWGVLPDAIQEWSGIDSDSGLYGADQPRTLATQNDRGASFQEIADIIEAEF